MLVVVTSRPGKEREAAMEVLDFLVPWDPRASVHACRVWPGVSLIKTGLDYETVLSILRRERRYVAIKAIPLEYVADTVGVAVEIIRKRVEEVYSIVIFRRGGFPYKELKSRLAGLIRGPRGEKVVVIEGLGGWVGISFLSKVLYLRLSGRRRVPSGIVLI